MIDLLFLRFVLVLLESVATGHKKAWRRERVSDKLEMLLRDPYGKCIYL